MRSFRHWAAAGFAGLLCACGAPERGDILLVTIDTLRADHLSLYGYERPTSPQLARLFADGAVFERAYATTSYTSASTASLLTGLWPQEHGVRLFDQIFPRDVAVLPELLPEAYVSAAFISTTILSDDATGLANRFDHFDDDVGPFVGPVAPERPAAPTTEAALRWLRESRDPERPLFLWVHYKDPHAPYAPPEAYAAPGAQAVKPRDRTPRVQVRNYDGEIAYVDAEVGRLLDGYAEHFEIDEALVVVTADHGETLLERKVRFSHAFHVWEELVRVPLLLRGPGVVPGRRTDLVSGIDLAPTLLRFAGADLTDVLPGRDLRAPPGAEPDRDVFVESSRRFDHTQWRGLIREDRKWTLLIGADGEPAEGGTEWDLRDDPGERRGRPWRPADPAARRLLGAVAADPHPGANPPDAERGSLREKNLRLLEMLGYTEIGKVSEEAATSWLEGDDKAEEPPDSP